MTSAEERKAVVAWLRGQDARWASEAARVSKPYKGALEMAAATYASAAVAIEAGLHLTGEWHG